MRQAGAGGVPWACPGPVPWRRWLGPPWLRRRLLWVPPFPQDRVRLGGCLRLSRVAGFEVVGAGEPAGLLPGCSPPAASEKVLGEGRDFPGLTVGVGAQPQPGWGKGWLCFELAAVSHLRSPVLWALLEAEEVQVHLKLGPFSMLSLKL